MTEFALASRRGWLMCSTQEQRQAWFEDCRRRQADCICVWSTEKGFFLDCLVWEGAPLSELGYAEIGELFNGWKLGGYTFGDDWDNSSQFSAELPAGANLDEFIAEVRSCLARDRTAKRRAELSHNLAPREGMALARSAENLWEGHRLSDPIYVLELADSPGRCLVLKHLHPALLNLPLDQFRFLNS